MSVRKFDPLLVRAIDDAFSVLPEYFDSPAARAMIYATGLQESRFEHRLQIGGPARSFWQGELTGGMILVLQHPMTRRHADLVCLTLCIKNDPRTVYEAIAWNDVLACALARLLLYTLPSALPREGDHEESWRQYMDAWRPGRPHRHTWNTYYDAAWDFVNGR